MNIQNRQIQKDRLAVAKGWGEEELGLTVNVPGAPLLGEGDILEFVVIVMVAMHHLRDSTVNSR